MRALILHAHPDDEAIWAGALMLSRPRWDWTTVSLTGGLRAAEYPGQSLGHPDPWRILTLDEFRAWRASVDALRLDPDIVITHNRMGEYGHPHHMAVHRIAHELFPGQTWDFYSPAESSVGGQLAGPVLSSIPVTSAKAERFREVYGAGVFDELRQSQPELMAQEFDTGPEMFTGLRGLPL